MDDEHKLVDKVTSGDLQAFKILVEKYQRLVTHIVFRLILNEADREEICQDVFMRIYQNLSNFKFQSKLSTWIGKIAHNTCINYLKKKKLPLYEDLIEFENKHYNRDHSDKYKSIESVQGEMLLPDEAAIAGEISGLLFKKINQLPAQFRAILTLYHLENLNYEEIAEILELPLGTIKSYLFRARKHLKDLLLKLYQPEEFLE
jgi:RNA polymerase sigma-70 factor (ECF subfamily)